jgi:hypothetical protein
MELAEDNTRLLLLVALLPLHGASTTICATFWEWRRRAPAVQLWHERTRIAEQRLSVLA